MLILDSDIVIELERRNKDVLTALHKLRQEHPENLAITSAVYAEVYYGALAVPAKAAKVTELLQAFDILNFDAKSAQKFSETKLFLEKSGNMVPIFDLLTAAIALENKSI